MLNNSALAWLTCQLIFCSVFAAQVSAETYYVSPGGDDKNQGTSEDEPFQQVQHAVNKMKSGDKLVVLDGVYTGTLKLKSGITIEAKNPRKVVFSGAERLTGEFEKHSGNIYKIKIDKDVERVFYKDEPMTWAQWPNITWAENWQSDKKWVSSTKGRGSGPGKLVCESFSDLKGRDLVGGYCFLRYSKGNSCYSRLIKSFNGNTLEWDDSNFYSVPFSGEDGRRGSPAAIAKGKSKPEVRARFFLAGALDLLDSEGEWFANNGTLYLYAPGGKKPNASDVLCKTNDYVIYETAPLSDVKIEGVDFFATSIKLESPKNKSIKFENSHFTYIGGALLFKDIPQGNKAQKPIEVTGSKMRFTRCLFAGAQNSALLLGGALNVVENCVFAENNRHANFQSMALWLKPTAAFKIHGNTFFNNCSDAIRFKMGQDYDDAVKPQISNNNICNAGLFNSDVSGVYMPSLSQHWTEFHHNWVHNIHGNGVRLDQAGEKLTVHHNVFWASKRGLNIEGFGNFNIYNNTSVLNKEADAMTRNVVGKRKGTGDAVVSNDTSFPPIDDWNILNNLVTNFIDRIGPSEGGPFAESLKNGTLDRERPKKGSIPIEDRGAIQGNWTGFKQKIFKNGNLDGLNLIPKARVVRDGADSTKKLEAEGVTDLGVYRGAYDLDDKGWPVGSDWMPYGVEVPTTMKQAEQLAKKYRNVSLVPEVNVTKLPSGILSPKSFMKRASEAVPERPSDQPSEGLTKKQKRQRNRQNKLDREVANLSDRYEAYSSVSIVPLTVAPRISAAELPSGQLSAKSFFKPASEGEIEMPPKKKKRNKKKIKGEKQSSPKEGVPATQ